MGNYFLNIQYAVMHTYVYDEYPTSLLFVPHYFLSLKREMENSSLYLKYFGNLDPISISQIVISFYNFFPVNKLDYQLCLRSLQPLNRIDMRTK